jgi:hypothetical protein
VPVQNQESTLSGIFASIFTNLVLDFGTVLTVWYLLFLFYSNSTSEIVYATNTTIGEELEDTKRDNQNP